MRVGILFMLILITVWVFPSCKKAGSIDVSTIKLPVHSTIRSIQKVGEAYIVTGGNNGSSGFVGVMNEELSQLELLNEDFENPVYDIAKFNGRYILCADSSEIFYSSDLTTYTPHVFIPDHWVEHLYKRPLRQLEVSATGHLHVAGGGLLTFGVIYTSADSTTHWKPTQFDNEMRAIYSLGEKLWAAGFGALITSVDGGASWQHIVHEGFYFSDLWFQNEKEGVLTTYDGKIYTTRDGGQTLQKKFSRKSVAGTTGINKLAVSPSGSLLVAAGNKSWLTISKDNGVNWQPFRVDFGLEIKDLVFSSENEIVLVGENGFMGKVNLP